MYQKVLKTGQPRSFVNEYQLEGKDFFFEISAYPSRRGLSVFVKDITERKKAQNNLKESEEKYRSLFESMLNGFAYCKILVDEDNQPIDFVHLEVNDVWERSTGLKKEDVIGKKVTEVIPCIKESETDLISIYGKVALTGEASKFDLYFEPFDKWFTISVYSPSKGYFVAVFEDITKRKKTEEELKQKTEQQQVLLSSIPVFVYYKNTESKLITANKAFAEMVNVPIDQLVGKTAYDLFPKEQAEHFHIDDKSVMESGKSAMNIEEEFTDAKGKTRWASTSKIPYFDDKGQVTGMVGITSDITERKMAKDALQKAHDELEKRVEERTAELAKSHGELLRTKDYLQNVIDSASEIIVSFDKDNKVSTWNKQAEYITGFKQKNIVGRHISKLKVFDNPKELLDDVQYIYDGKKPESDTLVLKAKSDVKKIIKTSFSTVKGDKERTIGVLLVGKDITSEMEAHGKLLTGNSYIVSDKNNKSALDLFTNLTTTGCKGLCITRANPEVIRSNIPSKNIQTMILKQNTVRGFEHIPDLETLTVRIKDFTEKNPNSVVLLDRVDYLLSNFSFEQLIKSLYQISDIISENNSLLLFHIDPALLDARQMAIVENELRLLPSQKIEDIQLKDELYDILKFIYEQNQKNAVVSVKNIAKEFSIVDKTTTKRLKNLEDNGLIFIKKLGRTKTLNASDKGKTLLHKRQVI